MGNCISLLCVVTTGKTNDHMNMTLKNKKYDQKLH